MIRIGPSGWSYPDWEGPVYPRSKPRAYHPLDLLATLVDYVEVNSSFYAVPRAQNSSNWVARVAHQKSFRFGAKLLQDFTHKPIPEDLAQWEELAVEWRRGIAPLEEKGLLSAVLVQFPVTFQPNDDSVARLGHIARLFDGLPLVLEVRHREWFEPPSLTTIGGLGYSLAHIDLPPSWNHPPASHAAVGPVGYVRLHGRNSEQWFRSGAGRNDCYDYLSSPPELGEIAHRIDAVAKASDETLVATNNHFEGQALANALELRWLMGGREPVAASAELVRAFPHLADITRVMGQRDLYGPASGRNPA